MMRRKDFTAFVSEMIACLRMIWSTKISWKDYTAPWSAVLQKVFRLTLIAQNTPYPVKNLNQIIWDIFFLTLTQALHKVWFILSVANCKHIALSP